MVEISYVIVACLLTGLLALAGGYSVTRLQDRFRLSAANAHVAEITANATRNLVLRLVWNIALPRCPARRRR